MKRILAWILMILNIIGVIGRIVLIYHGEPASEHIGWLIGNICAALLMFLIIKVERNKLKGE